MESSSQFMVSASASSPAQGRKVRLRLRRAFRWTAALAVLFCSLGVGQAVAEEPSSPELPGFLFEPLYASNQGSVYGIYSASHADLVLVAGGFDAGFRNGMVLRVFDDSGDVAEVMLVEVRENCAAGLILQLAEGKVIEAGHSVKIKTVKF